MHLLVAELFRCYRLDRPECAVLDPGRDVDDLTVGQLCRAFRHFQLAAMLDRSDQQTLFGVTRDDCRSGFSTL